MTRRAPTETVMLATALPNHAPGLLRYTSLIALVRNDPTVIFTLPRASDRIVAYLTICAPHTRTSSAILHGARVHNPGAALRDLVRQHAVRRYERSPGEPFLRYVLHPDGPWNTKEAYL